MRLNQFLKIEAPQDADVDKLMSSFKRFDGLIDGGVDWGSVEGSDGDSVLKLIEVFKSQDKKTPIVAALSLVCRAEEACEPDIPEDFFNDLMSSVEEEDLDYLTIFTPFQDNDYLKSVLLINQNDESFAQSILARRTTRDNIEYIEKLSGRSSQQATNVAMELIADLESGTRYPPEVKPDFTAEDITFITRDIINKIALSQQENEEG